MEEDVIASYRINGRTQEEMSVFVANVPRISGKGTTDLHIFPFSLSKSIFRVANGSVFYILETFCTFRWLATFL